jgi:transglycosylase-like protein
VRGVVAAVLTASLLATLATLWTDLGTAGGAEGVVAGQEVRLTAVPRKREHGYGLVAFRGLGPERWYARWRALRELLAVRTDGLVGLVAAFLCVHSHEAHSWATNTGNGYFGGLQMDMTFQRAYAPDLLREKGTADHWSPGEQIAVAIEAHAERGWWPWPNTARACGLLP